MSSYTDDSTTEIKCPFCSKVFVINTNQMGEITICPHCTTIMTADQSMTADIDLTIPKVPPR